MATDPRDISLTLRQRQRVAELADATGSSWPELLDQLLERASPTAEATGARAEESLFERLQSHGYIGCVDDAPVDLSTNPQYMEGFGESRRAKMLD